MKAAIYARVSDGKHQDATNQLVELKRYADSRGWECLDPYVDGDSGCREDRPELLRLFDDCYRKKFDVVLVWALDRLTREGVSKTFAYIQTFKRYGIEFESYTEPLFRTAGPAGELMIAVAAWIAEQERKRLKERVNAGIARAKKDGRKFGRPKRIFNRARAVELRESGLSWKAISLELGVPAGTCRDAVLEQKA